ncbi:Upc2p NDAI_0C04840 [Naumovozyma dairenensis CBS 421]|uniref:Zn(2)-C6 fungal-type domain-containing protein n=1 Tax=Naumovozyma dairenensis (strain ATCC 10597 / BCRC 20456 / CBS 421 / NBRC 0211 / NRRL Y-12639) TaxID=1071378 RepID=G0W8N2_NAUDC|nr:hypothetical protein NDAI_0C04840 [Naumovozyma dairenensis CBS 421]CCD24143.1 hypothetical protein NDAI_0C04840 [Naumovozyma dairenensis CBS 421]
MVITNEAATELVDTPSSADTNVTAESTNGKKEKVVELIEVGGKKVSKTSTGKRKFHNKSKNGCDNCKKRRVKCDEVKPSCKKCTNMQLTCVYSPLQPRKRPKGPPVLKHVATSEKIMAGSPNNGIDVAIKRERSEMNLGLGLERKILPPPSGIFNTAATTASGLPASPLNSISMKMQMSSASNDTQKFIPKEQNQFSNLLAQSQRLLSSDNNLAPQLSPQLLQQTQLPPQPPPLQLLTQLQSSASPFNVDPSLLPQLLAGLASNPLLQQQLQQFLPQFNLNNIPQPQPTNNTFIPPIPNMNSIPNIPQVASMPNLANIPKPNESTTSTNPGMFVPENFVAGPFHAQQQLQYQLHQQLQLQQHQQIQLQQNQQYQLQQQQLQEQLQEQLKSQQKHIIEAQLHHHQQQQQGQQHEQQRQEQRTTEELDISPKSNLPINIGQQDADTIQQQREQQTQQNMPSIRAADSATIQADTLSQLNKIGLDLKALGSFPTAGIGGISYDFQELLGMKVNSNNNNAAQNSRAAKVNSAQEALATMQQQQEQANKNSEILENDKKKKVQSSNSPSIISILSSSDPTATASSSATSVESTGTDNNLTTKPDSNQQQQHKQSNDASSLPLRKSGSISEAPLSSVEKLFKLSTKANLNLIDMKLFHHYCTEVWPTITAAKVSGPEVWSKAIPKLAFDFPFLMHSILALSATHLARAEPGLGQYVSTHRLDALRLLREAVLEISEENTDALVASALILIMDSLANAASPTDSSPNNILSPSAWVFHVKGAATILTAVWPLSEKSIFYNLISVDLSALGNVINEDDDTISELYCFDENLVDLYPVEIGSPYLITLAYLDKLHREKNQSDFILRVFAFPALLDKTFLALLMTGDLGAMRIMRSYYKLLRDFTTEVKDTVWFLEGITKVLPSNVDSYAGGGGLHMMLDFLGGGLPSMSTTNMSDFL